MTLEATTFETKETARAKDKIPATIVTGFLGAGKTTLIRNLLERPGGRRIALIINEFGDVGFDGTLLKECGIEGCTEDDVVELSNGCICCTVADDFLPAMEALLDRRDPPDHILIETSGLALPQPLVKAFAWPSVKTRVTVDGVVTVVDAAALAEGRVAMDQERLEAQRAADEALDHDDPIEELFEDQLRCADLVVLSKSDLVDPEQKSRVENVIKADMRSAARSVASTEKGLPADVLLGLSASAEDDNKTRLSHHEMAGAEDHEHDDFDSFTLKMSAPDRESAVARVEAAMALDGVLRVKGLSQIDGRDAPLAIQAVGPRVESWFMPNRDKDEGSIVVIGLADLDQAAVTSVLTGQA